MTAATAGYVGGLIAVALIAYLASTAAAHARNVAGRRVLYYDGRVKLLGWVLFAMIAPIVAFFLYSALHIPTNQAPLAVTASAVFISLALFLVLEFHRVTITFDATSIFCQSPWRRSRVIAWADVVSIKYSPALRWYVVKTKAHGTIRLNSMLSGLHEFLTEAQRRGIAV